MCVCAGVACVHDLYVCFVRIPLDTYLMLMQFEVTANYSLVWNEHQEWRVDFTACKAVVYLIFAHKDFFSGELQRIKHSLYIRMELKEDEIKKKTSSQDR